MVPVHSESNRPERVRTRLPTSRDGDHLTFEPGPLSIEATTVPEPVGDRVSRAIFAVLVLSASLVILAWVVFFVFSSLSHPVGG